MKPRCTLITKPFNDAVYQRDGNNYAHIPLEVLYTRPVCRIRIKAVRQDYISEWTDLTLYSGTASGSMTLPAGDWFTLFMEAVDETGKVVEEDKIDRIGAGEVFITCGQSNSLNFGEALTKAESNLVTCFNPRSHNWEACRDPQPCEAGPEVDMGEGGSIWPTVGDLLAEQLKMPIGFYATGWGGAALEEFGRETVKYKRLLSAVSKAGAFGVRAVLWHQGETDAVYATDTQKYKALLLDLISRTRTDSGWNIPFMVARAAYHPKAERDKETAIKTAQLLCCNGKDILEGPDSDTLQGELRIANSAHFTLPGLQAHGKLWAKALLNYL
ncbi:sialate O-acetylesterase [Anaerocolumna sp. AGMB13025]|uniref:sialate O-acetylesterase n=1 Tax=Anaerocolumna sp. AGMB13025 TaxID=3039116 RepID=UPI00241F1BEA|nr:sialate O-acetylesterase [Anaerocolumna sp. AGMB13025]WFR57680.1 sialate O-acetylesterase [Anaerocolumna sp. AGMB13025]